MMTAARRVIASRFHLWIVLLVTMTGLGFWAIVAGFVRGHEVTFNTGTGVPWGILIAGYVFLVVSCSGMCLVSSLGHVFGIERFEPLARRAIFLAIVLLLSGFLVIASDLERPWRMVLYLFLTPNPASAMWWMGTLYSLYLVAMLLEFVFLCRAEIVRRIESSSGTVSAFHRAFLVGIREVSPGAVRSNLRLARVSGVAAVIFALAALSTLGSVFGFIGSRTIWHGPFLPIYFILSAYVSGSAILILSLVFSHRGKGNQPAPEIREIIRSLSRLLLVFLAIFLFFAIWKLLTAQYGRIPEEFESVMLVISGPLAVPFWVGEVTFGILVPIAILAYTRGRNVWGLTAAATMVIVGMFVARYDFVIGGQLVPIVGREPLWQYSPHAIEILSILGAISLCLLLYSVGGRFLPLEDYRPVSGQSGETETSPVVAPETVAAAPQIDSRS